MVPFFAATDRQTALAKHPRFTPRKFNRFSSVIQPLFNRFSSFFNAFSREIKITFSGGFAEAHRELTPPVRVWAPCARGGRQQNILNLTKTDRKSTRLNSSHLGISY